MQDSHFKNSKISIFVLPVIMLIYIVFKLFYTYKTTYNIASNIIKK